MASTACPPPRRKPAARASLPAAPSCGRGSTPPRAACARRPARRLRRSPESRLASLIGFLLRISCPCTNARAEASWKLLKRWLLTKRGRVCGWTRRVRWNTREHNTSEIQWIGGRGLEALGLSRRATHMTQQVDCFGPRELLANESGDEPAAANFAPRFHAAIRHQQ